MAPPRSAPGRLVVALDDLVDSLVARLRGNRVADRVFYTASSLGEFSLLWIALALARGLRGGPRHERAALRAIVAAVAESLAIDAGLKTLIRRERPVPVVAHPLPFRQPLTSSFPSGHATAAFMGATLLAEGDRLGPLYYSCAAVVAASRSYVRIHHASDVLGGAAIGLALGRLGRRLAPLQRRSTMRPGSAGAGGAHQRDDDDKGAIGA